MTDSFQRYTKNEYNPVVSGSIDGTDTEPHDQAVNRALNSKYHKNLNLKSNPKNTIFVAGLHNNTDEKTLRNKFGRFGTILDCKVIRDLVTGHSKYYGFIEFKRREQAREALHNMHRSLIDQSEILVEYEVGRVLKGWKPRRLGGGFGGKRESGQLRFGGRARPFVRPIDKETPTASNYQTTKYGGSRSDNKTRDRCEL